jgi:DNA polymerase V
MSVFLTTNRYRTDQPQYHNSCLFRLPSPSNATPELIRHAHAGLARIYREGYDYHRVGILLAELVADTPLQLSMYETVESREKLSRLMSVIDALNARYGQDTVQFASAGHTYPWGNRSANRSPRYTTQWREIVVVFAW